MNNQRKKPPREKDLTSRFFSGDLETDRVPKQQRFTNRSKNAQQEKIERTAVLRSGDAVQAADMEAQPIGSVIQVYSRLYEVEHETGVRLCMARKTLNKLGETAIVVGDRVRFRDLGATDEQGRPEAIIEQVLPRDTILTRADSFHGRHQHPIVANAQQMLIVASLLQPRVKWQLVDRMLVAAQSGGLTPIVCLNKIDLAEADDKSKEALADAQLSLDHYNTMGIITIKTIAEQQVGINEVREMLAGKTTVLAGHSGVGKSTLISTVQPGLDIRIGVVSSVTDKGRHTTTSVRRYHLDSGGFVIDTPGVKVFGLWDVSQANLRKYFPDVEDGTAPPWRVQSYERLAETL
ncbi:MAG: ribosome small subunit-dependent GTPase A [Planctomycetota bacterium]|nr:ribosome small subunit-dependent GTPase A [Planctomycetota bacterium]